MHCIFSRFLQFSRVARNSLQPRWADWTLEDIESATLIVTDQHGNHITHISLPISQVAYSMNTIEVHIGTSNCSRREKSMDSGSQGRKIREASLLISQLLSLPIGDHSDWQIEDVARLPCVGSNAGYSCLGGSSCGNVARIWANKDLVGGSVSIESNT